MSAGTANNNLRVHNDLTELAPLFRVAVENAIAECRRQGLDAIVYEAYRSQELQAEYFSRGRTKRPPLQTVTNAPTNLQSWHGYGLAVDVISKSKQWSAGSEWFGKVAEIFKQNNCKWGGDWKNADPPHFQWHLCKASPSDEAKRLIREKGAQAVWAAVGATGDVPAALPPAVVVTEQEVDVRHAVVTAKGLNLRPAATTQGDPITTLPRGTALEVLEPHGSWFRVRANGIEGFVHGDHIALQDHSFSAGFLAADVALQAVPLKAAAQVPLPPTTDKQARLAADTWNKYGGLIEPLCKKIGVSPGAAVAVLCVESGGRAFDGARMIIRFEAHIFYKHWGKKNPDAFRRVFRFDEDEPWKEQQYDDGAGFRPIHDKGQAREWEVFDAARKLDRNAALRSISMGAPQIMGFNHGIIGYDDVEEMFDRFQDARFQILGMFDFIKGSGSASPMVQALQQENYEAFATRYNGAGQASIYGSRIRKFAEVFPSTQLA
jgi:hypothetical protein